MNHLDLFLKNKVADMRRAAPDCDVWLFPEAEGYTAYKSALEWKKIPLENVNKHIQECTANGLNVALIDRVSLGQHGGWKTILIAKIPAAVKEDFT
jgi:hypothetical protein